MDGPSEATGHRDDAPVPPSDELEELLARCLEQLDEAGEEGLLEVLAEHPAHAATLRRKLARIERTGLVRRGAAFGSEAIPERLGDFRLIRRLGGGGMGVVYLAEQESLARRVALKLVRPEQLFFAGARARFQREIEAVARLQHPGIVPVYAVGEEQGVPYFAMEWIGGCTLAEVLVEVTGRDVARLRGSDFRDAIRRVRRRQRELHPEEAGQEPDTEEGDELFAGSWAEVCARVVRRVADALEHAHARGILHRDLKPSNLMVTSSGRVLVLDFGLARAEGSARLTRTGSALGSLAYMPPEQVEGDAAAASARSDIYSLGVTLYELLCLSAPFLDATPTRLREAIVRGDMAPIRRRNRTVSRDLAAICQVATDRAPDRRYPSMLELARELERFLRHEPICGHAPPLALRAARWMQRHPTRSVALLLGILVFVVTPLGLWRLETAAGQRIAIERDRAEANYRRARQAVERFLLRVASDDFRFVPQASEIRTALFRDAVELFQGLIDEKGERPDLLALKADALAQLANLQNLLGKEDEADALRAQSSVLYRDLSRAFPANDSYAACLAGNEVDRGSACWNRAASEEAEAAFRSAIDLLTPAVARNPRDAMALRTLATAHARLGVVLVETNRPEEAATCLQEAYRGQDRLAKVEPGSRDDGCRRAQVCMSLASLARRLGRWDDALARTQEAVNGMEAIVTAEPSSPTSREELARALLLLAEERFRRGEVPAALAADGRSIALYEELLAEHPTLAWLREELASSLVRSTNLRRRVGRIDEARERCTRACHLLEDLRKEQPDSLLYLRELAAAYATLGSVAGQGKDAEAQVRHTRLAAEMQEQLVEHAPDSDDCRAQLSRTWNDLSIMLRRQGELEDAEELLRRSLAIKEQLVRDHPERITYRVSWAKGLHAIAQLRQSQGDRNAAFVHYQEAIAEKRRILATAEAGHVDWSSLAASLRNAGLLQLEEKRVEEARSFLEEALAQQRAAFRAAPQNPAYRRDLIEVLERVGDIARHDGAHARLRELAQEMVSTDPQGTTSPIRAAILVLGSIPLMQADAGIDDAESSRRARTAVDQAMTWVTQGVANGYRDAQQLRENQHLEPLRELPTFQTLIQNIEAAKKEG